jgi:hypothetical protein
LALDEAVAILGKHDLVWERRLAATQSHEKDVSRRDAAHTTPIYRDFLLRLLKKY